MNNPVMPDSSLIENLLRESGYASSHPIEVVKVQAQNRGSKQIFSIKLDGSRPAGVPENLILKSYPGLSNEIQFYQANASKNLPIPGCFGASQGHESWILLEDLSLSHTEASEWPHPLPLQATNEILEALAQLHAASWDRNEDKPPDFLSSRAGHENLVEFLRRDFERYRKDLKARISQRDIDMLEQTLHNLPGLWDAFWEPRLASGRGLPVIHGDLNPCNVFYPNQSGGKVKFIDWEAHRRGLGASDITMLFCLHLCPSYDELLPYLHTYYQYLVRAGVEGTSFEMLLDDLLVALQYEVFYPVKLYSLFGIDDREMLNNGLEALASLSATW